MQPLVFLCKSSTVPGFSKGCSSATNAGGNGGGTGGPEAKTFPILKQWSIIQNVTYY